MPTLRMGKAFIYEDGGADFMARVIDPSDGARSVQGDITGITYAVFDLNGEEITKPVSSGSLTVSSVIFNSLQTDSRWTVDSTGYNFRDIRTPADFPIGGHTYRVEYLFNPSAAGTQDFFVCFEVTTVRVYTS